jgi:rsbT co-antagonist protein RsbR
MSGEHASESRVTLEDIEEFFELSLEMICIAGYDGYFKRLNPVWSRVLGYSLEELMAEPYMSFVHPDDRDATKAVRKVAAVDDREVVSFKNRYRCKDGSYRTLEWNTAPSRRKQFLCAVARDVTERDRAQERLNHLVKASRTVLYSLDVGPEGVRGCSFMSENVTTQFGYSVREVIGPATVWSECVHPDDMPMLVESFQELLQTGEQQRKYRFRHKDGTYRWVYDERKLMRDAEGKPLEIVGTWRDISEFVHAEELIRRQAMALTELSTPLIPISEQVVVMPLIGTLDSQRAKQILDTLLEGVAKSRASVAILDITGVSVVDTQVANALLQAAKAVKLLGAEVVLTGIRPDVAQTLVGLGLDLSDIATRGTLQAGIGYAMGAGTHEAYARRPREGRDGER